MSEEIGYNKKQNQYFNGILDQMMDETIISGSELKFPFLSPETNSKDLYNQFLPNATKGIIHFINRPLSPNLTTMSYKIGEYMKEVYGVTDEEVGFLWDLYRERIKSKLNKFLQKQLPPSVFNTIIADLWERTVKIPRTDKPLCTGGSLEDYDYWCTRCNQTHKQQKGGDQEGPYDRANLVVQLHLPSSEFPYNVETGRGRSWGQLNDYLTGQYGLTPEECQKVWDRYRTTICKNPQLPTLHESKSFNTTHFNFLEKVAQTIDDNTPIYYKEDALHIEFPYFNITTHQTYRAPKSKWGTDKLRHYDTQLQSLKEIITGLWTIIGGKIMDIFGLTHDEADIVYKWYQELLQRKAEEVLGPIFEIDPTSLNESKDDERVFTTDKKKEKQQKVLDYAIEDLTNNTSLDWGYNEYHNDGNNYQIIRFPFSVYPHEDPTKNRLEWIMIDPHYNLDITQFYKQFKPHAIMMYGLTDVELMKVFADWEGELIEKIRDHSETDPPRA